MLLSISAHDAKRTTALANSRPPWNAQDLAREMPVSRQMNPTPRTRVSGPARCVGISMDTQTGFLSYRTNDYSVEWGHREVLVKRFVHEVVICASSEVIARHPRSYEREDMIFNPLHYLALLEQKTNALDQAAPLVGWKMPDGFDELRRLMEARLGKKGKRECVQVLRLLETFALAEVERAIDDALRMETSRSTPSSTCCCAASSRGRRGWVWRIIRTCLWRRWRPPPPPITSHSWVLVDMDTPQVLLDHHLKTLRLPTFLREYDKVAQQCATEGVDFPRCLLRLSELELLDRERRATERRIRQAKFDVVKSLATVPNSAPTPAVIAIASAPQNVTRSAPVTLCFLIPICGCGRPAPRVVNCAWTKPGR